MKLAAQHVVSAIIAIGVFAPVWWMVTDRTEPFVITGGQIEPTQVAPGGSIKVTWQIKVLRSCPTDGTSTVTRTFIDKDKQRHVMEPEKAHFNSKQPDQSKVQNLVLVPSTMPLGPAKYRSRACYPCNPIQELWPICIDTPELPFEVVDAK